MSTSPYPALPRRRTRLSWLAVGALLATALLAPAPTLAIPGDPTVAPNAESRELVAGNASCAQDQYFVETIDGAPTDGTHGAVTISGSTSASFDWGMTAQALHDYDTDAIIVQSESSAYVYFYLNDTDDSDTNLVSPDGSAITSVSFCFDQKAGPDPTPTPTPTATPTATPTPTPSPTPTATPGVGQFEFPTIGLTDCEEPGGSGSIIVSGFAATNGGELVLNPGAGEIVITDNGTYPLEPGTYSAIVRFEGETVAGPTEFTIEACPGEPTPTPTTAPTDTPTVEPTPAPTGGVLPAVGTPAPTLPPTDTVTGTGGTGSDGWRFALLAIAGLLAGALMLSPASVVARRGDDESGA